MVDFSTISLENTTFKMKFAIYLYYLNLNVSVIITINYLRYKKERVLIQNTVIIGGIKLQGENQIFLQRYY